MELKERRYSSNTGYVDRRVCVGDDEISFPVRSASAGARQVGRTDRRMAGAVLLRRVIPEIVESKLGLPSYGGQDRPLVLPHVDRPCILAVLALSSHPPSQQQQVQGRLHK